MRFFSLVNQNKPNVPRVPDPLMEGQENPKSFLSN